MADDEDEAEPEPVVELGEGPSVEGAPLARVVSRQTWGIEKSRLLEREAETELRTPDGPKRLGDVLDAVEQVYFTRRQDFEEAIEGVIGIGPVPTDDDGDNRHNAEASGASDDSDADPNPATDSDRAADPDSASDSEADFDFDPDPDDDTESGAMAQGEAHAETSSATNAEATNEPDAED